MDEKPLQSAPAAPSISPSVAEMLADRHQNIVDKTPELQQKSKGRGLFILNLIFFITGLLGIGFGIYSFYRLRGVETILKVKEIELERMLNIEEEVKGVATTLVPTITPTFSPLTPTPTIDPNKIPYGYVPKQTLCYTIYIPRDNTAGDENSCELIFDATIAEIVDLGINIQTEYAKLTSLQEMVQTSTESFTNRYEPSEKIKVGELDGEKIIELLPDGTKLIHVYVFVPDKYKVGGLMASGFEITKSLTDDTEDKQLEVLHTILATWKWK